MCEIDSTKMLTATIAIVTVYIAYQQLKTNRQKLRIDLYDRRLKIYEDTRHFIKAAQNNDLTSDTLLTFEKAIFDSDFLFEPDIKEYLEEVYDRGKHHGYLCEQYKYCNSPIIPPGYNIDEILPQKRAESEWLLAQRKIAKIKFKKYLAFHDSWDIRTLHSVRRFSRRLSLFRKSKKPF